MSDGRRTALTADTSFSVVFVRFSRLHTALLSFANTHNRPSSASLHHTAAAATSASAAAAVVAAPAMSSDRVLKIQIISDNICPFCYIGKKKIEAAVSRLPKDVRVQYEWMPFELDPTLPTTSIDKLTRYRQKFGAQRVESMLSVMTAHGKAWGINFNYGGNMGNTINSHRLVEFSKTPAGGNGAHTDALINALFASYFENRGDIASEDMLVAAALQAKLPASEAELRSFLRSDALRAEVHREVRAAQAAEITGVPHFVINGKTSVSGAQEPETFLAIFKKLGFTDASATPAAANAGAGAAAAAGATCDPNNKAAC